MQLLYVFGDLYDTYDANNSPVSMESSFLNKKNNIKFIVKGGYHTLIVVQEVNYDLIYGAGKNEDGQLGLDNDGDIVYEFTECKIFTNLKKRIKFINCGPRHSFIVTEDFKCYGLGYHFENYNVFKEIDTLDIDIIKNIKQVVCGGDRTSLILQNGDFYVHGDNSCQELDENNQEIKTFMKSKFSQPIIDIAFGYQHCLMITKSGEVYGSGNNSEHFQLGIDDDSKQNFLFEKIFPLQAQRVYCELTQSFILTNDFELYSCGWNVSGELLLGYTSSVVKTFQKVNLSSITIHKHDFEITVGFQHLFLKTGNEIYCGGYNMDGQLGLDDNESKCTLVKHPICESDKRVNEVICGGYGTFFIYNDRKNSKMEQLMFHNLKKLLARNLENNNPEKATIIYLSDISFCNF